MASVYPSGLRAPQEQRIVTSLPGIERPGTNILQVYGLADIQLPAVTIESALTVPAFFAGVAFLSRTLAALPLHAFRKTADGPQKISGGLETIIHEAPNPEWTAFKLRQHFWQQVFTGGRGLIYIERSGSNIVGLWPVDPSKVTVQRTTVGETTYKTDGRTFAASEIIDVPFMLRPDGLRHYSPVAQGAAAIQLALAMNEYGSQFFAGGGVPPLALVGPMPAGADAIKRAMADVQRSIDTARQNGSQITPIPPGYELKPIGIDPDKGQMTDARRFQVEEIARILGLPPIFLQDLTHGTFSNTEQQDLFFVKHLVGQWVDALEEEMNLKLFGQRNGGRYVEHNVDGLLRGDFKTRMDGLAQAVNSSILSPDEARALENRPAKGGNADKLFMQGATIPIDSMGTEPADAEGIVDGA
jgi:HK97 family phage portal protein